MLSLPFPACTYIFWLPFPFCVSIWILLQNLLLLFKKEWHFLEKYCNTFGRTILKQFKCIKDFWQISFYYTLIWLSVCVLILVGSFSFISLSQFFFYIYIFIHTIYVGIGSNISEKKRAATAAANSSSNRRWKKNFTLHLKMNVAEMSRTLNKIRKKRAMREK